MHAFRDAESSDIAVLRALPQEVGSWRVQAQALLQYGVQVWQARQIAALQRLLPLRTDQFLPSTAFF
jgi:hypothetical protein